MKKNLQGFNVASIMTQEQKFQDDWQICQTWQICRTQKKPKKKAA